MTTAAKAHHCNHSDISASQQVGGAECVWSRIIAGKGATHTQLSMAAQAGCPKYLPAIIPAAVPACATIMVYIMII
jgi:hypothetical protein